MEKVSTYAQRGGDISGLVVVQESLMARVSGCEQNTLAASASLPGGQAGVAFSNQTS